MFLSRLWKKKEYEIDYNKLPQHIAIIMDGNGRWARKRGLPRTVGHKEGSNKLKKIAKFCSNIGIKHLTVYAFSTENWKRTKEEVDTLMALLLDYMKNAEHHIGSDNVRIRVIGDVSALSKEIQNEIIRVKNVTEKNSGLTLYIAINYGSRHEIVNSVKNIIKDTQEGKLKPDEITEQTIEERLYTAGIPDPDLLIRPGGEMRISNYLLWQLAYTELYFTDVLWPDFRDHHILDAIKEFQNRNRRYGGI